MGPTAVVDSPARYVLDTHALWWYLTASRRLSAAASAVFRLAETGNATLIIPAITVAECYFLSVKLGRPLAPSTLMDAVEGVDGVELSDLGRAQLERLDELDEIPEMHDRLIAAESLAFNAPVVTRDELLTASSQVETIW